MDDEKYWAIYFAGICSLQFHPRNYVTQHSERIISAADIADKMLAEHIKRWGHDEEDKTCPG